MLRGRRIRRTHLSAAGIRDDGDERKPAPAPGAKDRANSDQPAVQPPDAGDYPLSSAVWTADFGAYEWDVATDRVHWLNDWCKHYDVDPCEGADHGKRWRARVHPDDRARALKAFDAHIARRRDRYEAEYRIQTLAGTWRWIRNRAYSIRGPDGQAVRLIGACVDVDERKRAEIGLERNQKKLEALAAAAPTWMVLTDASGIVEFTNRTLQGVEPANAIGRSILSFLDSPIEAARIERFRKALVQRGKPQSFTMVLEDGRSLTTWAQPISEGGKVVGIASVTADVTDRQHRERDLLEAVTREQQRFGRDLHDGLGQELTGATLLVRSLVTRAATEAPGLAPALEEVLGHLKTALNSSRAVARGVSPVGREQGGLVHALRRLVDSWQGMDGLQIDGQIDEEDAPQLDPLLADNLYRIAQEALTNVARHSVARHATVKYRQSEDGFRLVIADDGIGMPPGAEHGEGFGHKSMRGRAELVGAKLRIDSQIGKGTSIECFRDWNHGRPSVAVR